MYVIGGVINFDSPKNKINKHKYKQKDEWLLPWKSLMTD